MWNRKPAPPLNIDLPHWLTFAENREWLAQQRRDGLKVTEETKKLLGEV